MRRKIKTLLPWVFPFFFGASGVALIWGASSLVFRVLATGLLVSGVVASGLAIRDLERRIKFSARPSKAISREE